MNPILIKNYNAAGTIGANLFVKLNADRSVVAAAAASDFIIGASTEMPTSVLTGEPCDVIHAGIANVKAGAAVARGAYVTSDASGRAITAVDGDRVGGMALEAAGGADDIIPVLIIPTTFAAASQAGTDPHAIKDNPSGDQTIAGEHALINAGGFVGPLTGNVTGKVSGTAGGLQEVVTEAAADGAIGVKTGTVVITKDGVAALTLADPVDETDDGKRLTILSATANAHTVSNAAGSGFNGAGAASDVATFGAAIGNSMELVAVGGKWYVLRLTSVTLG